tara:strand:+ start:1242 stop:1403 length:162 start_codon:yes stop_codon:yes gene_type:complete
MKKLLLLAAMSISFSANAAILESEVIQGMKKICIYSDGTTITISSIGLCQLTK